MLQILTKFMQAKHKKYLGKTDAPGVNPAAASSTGTIESVEAEEPESPVQVVAGAGVSNTGNQSGPSPATPYIQSRTNTAQAAKPAQQVPAAAQSNKPLASEVTEFDDSEELVRSFNGGYVSVSDLSASSRDVR